MKKNQYNRIVKKGDKPIGREDQLVLSPFLFQEEKMEEQIKTLKSHEVSKKDLDEMLKGTTKVYGDAISAANFLFDKKSIDVVLLEDNRGLIIIADNKFALFFYKEENGELYFDGWETGKFHDKYWRDFKGKKL